MHVTEVAMYNVLHYPISFSAPSLHSKIGNIVFRVVRCRSESRSFSLCTPVTHVHRVCKETLSTRCIRSLDPVFHDLPDSSVVPKTLYFTLVVRSLDPHFMVGCGTPPSKKNQ